MSKPKPQFQSSNVLLIEILPRFIALCEASGASPQAALRGMAAMVCAPQYDEDNRLVPLKESQPDSASARYCRPILPVGHLG
jgi:hypothetical protein